MDRSKRYILWFDEISIEDVPLVGGKNASLGEMYRQLSKGGVRVPNGFAITATAYNHLLEHAGIKRAIKDILNKLNVKDLHNLSESGRKIRHTIREAQFPDDLRKEIIAAYHQLSKFHHTTNVDVAVRSSATAEDLPGASFAGQQETFLNITGEEQLIDACKDCFASLFTNRAIVYREEQGFDHFKVQLSIGIQKMVRSDQACSGVMFTVDTETGFKDVIFITGSWGLGENIVQGAVNPDEFLVFKPTLKQGFAAIISKTIGEKTLKRIYTDTGIKTTKDVLVNKEDRERFCLTDKETLHLAQWGCIIEDHYSKKKGTWCPMDIEWAKDGQTNELFIVQARPETVQSQKNPNVLEEYVLTQKGTILAQGKSVGNKIGQGNANIIHDVKDITQFKQGQVLVTEMTDPDWVVVMKQASAIVTNRGGRTCFSGDTLLLTNKGFKRFKEVYNDHEELLVPSLNEQTLKIEWKPIVAAMKRTSSMIEVEVSQTGRMHGNKLRMTPDHNIVTFHQRNIVGKEIQNVLCDNELLLVAQHIPAITESTNREQKWAYMLGALSTDGHVHLTNRHGEITFIQKPTEAKKIFIETMQTYAQEFFHKRFSVSQKKPSTVEIHGKPVVGTANAYRIYGKHLAQYVQAEQIGLTETLLHADTSFVYHFLAGVVDGDGSYNHKANRLHIYCADRSLLDAIIVACLRIGIVPQLSLNRTAYNIQIVEHIQDILQYTQRIKGTPNRTKFGTRFFASKQIFEDIKDSTNYKCCIKPYIDKNLLLDAEKINQHILPLCKDTIRDELTRIIQSDTRMQRVSFVQQCAIDDVYNITVADNHNYLVFTDRYTPIIVKNCHAAIVSRELGVPCVVGTNNATQTIKHGQKITVSCAEGEEGRVYEGLLKFKINRVDLKKITRPKTKVMMNVGNPDEAFSLSFLPNDGVGLAREEFIISSFIKAHPLALLHFDKMPADIKKEIEELTKGYHDKTEFFIDKLSQGVAMIGAAFYPKDVIVRMSDFKSNEYANLIGGRMFEPKEENPMIGWRGASRYYKPGYKEGFALECKAMKRVRDDLGLTNVKLMIPMCRTVDEGKKVLSVMAEYGLKRGKNGLEVYVMCEVPSNVILADEFSEIFDGFSIGSNDLTQLTLGIDRDSALIADIYDERNPAVTRMIATVIAIAKKHGRKIGICGDAPSTYPEFAEFLVNCGIDSISLSPDAVVKTTITIGHAEKRLRR